MSRNRSGRPVSLNTEPAWARPSGTGRVETEAADQRCNQNGSPFQAAAINEAARWYAANRDACERPTIPTLRRRFDLTPLQAVQVIREAARLLSLTTRSGRVVP